MLVNYWWRQTADYMDLPYHVLQHALLAMRGLPQNEKSVWRDIFEHYIFSAQQHKPTPDHAQGILAKLNHNSARQLRNLLLKQLNR